MAVHKVHCSVCLFLKFLDHGFDYDRWFLTIVISSDKEQSPEPSVLYESSNISFQISHPTTFNMIRIMEEKSVDLENMEEQRSGAPPYAQAGHEEANADEDFADDSSMDIE